MSGRETTNQSIWKDNPKPGQATALFDAREGRIGRMKPRFSILTLLGATAYVSVIAAAVVQPTSWIRYAPFWVGTILLIWLLPIAAGSTTAKSVFVRGVFLGLLLFQVMREVEPIFGDDAYQFFNWHPTSYDTYGWEEHNINAFYNAGRVVHQCFLSIAGAVGGCLALWRYRVLERREKKPDSNWDTHPTPTTSTKPKLGV